MKKILLLAILGIFGAVPGFSQSSTNPPCQFQYKFTNRPTDTPDGISVIALITGAARAPRINNMASMCNSWLIQYSTEGLSAQSLKLDSGASIYNGASSETPLSWSTFAGSTLSGSNPQTTTTSGYYSASGYFPWLSVVMTSSSGTGSSTVMLYGWKTPTLLAAIYTGTTAGGDLAGTYPNPTVQQIAGGVGNIGGCTQYAAGFGSSIQCSGFNAIFNGTTAFALGVSPSTSSGIAHPKFGCLFGSTDLTCRFIVGGVYGWTSGTTNAYDATLDSGISRITAGALAIGNGTTGDFSGSLKLTTINITGTSFTFNGKTCTLVSTAFVCS